MPFDALPQIAPDSAARFVSDAMLQRARSYASGGAVTDLVWTADSRILTSSVAGTERQPYRCTIALVPSGTIYTVERASCTCPVGLRCKHIAATLLVCAGEQLRRSAQKPNEPAWKSALGAPPTAPTGSVPSTSLALGFELRRRAVSTRRHAPQTPATAEDVVDGVSLRLRVRPLLPGRRGGWIKGNLSWRTLAHQQHRLGLDSEQLLWFTQFLGLYDATRNLALFGDTETVPLDEFRSPLLWTLLADAERVGITFAGFTRGLTVSLGARATLSLDLRSADDGLRLSPRVEVDGDTFRAQNAFAIGTSGLYATAVRGDSGIHVTLAPARAPLTPEALAMLNRTDAVAIPTADVPEFFSDYYPRVSAGIPVTSSDDSVDLPEVAPPELVLSATYGARDALTLAWHWEYHDPQRTLHFAPSAGERRDADTESATTAQVERAWPDVQWSTSHTLRDVETAEFTEHVLPVLESLGGVRVDVSGTRPEYRELTESPHVAITTVETEQNDWFDLGFVITIEGRTIPFIDLFNALARGKKKLKLVDRTYFSLAHPAFDRLRELLAEADSLDEWEPDKPKINRYQASLWSEFEDLADETHEAVSWRNSVAAIADGTIAESAVPKALNAELRPYQVHGFQWLAFLWQQRLGGILADDMGLGKTLQALALITHAREEKGTDAGEPPFLVIAPTSVISTWQSEAQRFAPHLDVRIIEATQGKRKTPLAQAVAGADVVIMSYAVMRIDAVHVTEMPWAGLILDEAQFVKNPDSKSHAAAKDIQAPFRLAITGTPLENSLLDLWALCSITAPGLFPSRRRFGEEYVKPVESGEAPERLARLRRRIRPFMMRRTKELVAPELPDKQEQTISVELASDHRSLYDTVLQRERKKLLGLIDDMDRNRFIVFRSLTLLRMLALDPSLVDTEYAGITASKLDVLFEHIDALVSEGHRTLVFSQFTSFLGNVAEQLDARGIRYSYLDGSTRRRKTVIDEFREGDNPVFLISLKAGGFGLTLTEADYVFMLDPWWNPASEAQAIDRTHRIGQTKNVFVYRLVAEGTIEEKVMALQRKKAALFEAVVDDDAAFSSALTADDIRMLLDDV